MAMAMGVKGWIQGDETAKEVFSRFERSCPFLLLPPPLHTLPLRSGNAVEIVGPSPSAKTHILMQVAISCILPKEYGGLGYLLIFIDLDCRFDVLRLSHLLKNRIMEAITTRSSSPIANAEEELFKMCMRRFIYARCYDSLQFLATLKTLHHKIQKEKEADGISHILMMIDSIGAFHWVDRASTSLNVEGNNRKGLSLQNVSDAAVQEIKNLLLVHSVLIIATKAVILGDRNPKRPSSLDSRNIINSTQQPLYREFMPSVWQSIFTHRILIRATDDHVSISKDHNQSVYLFEWLLPALKNVDKFIVKDVGVFCVL